MTSLAARQAELVAALVAGGPTPPGFDADRLAATRHALLRKRAGEVAAAWPLLAAGRGAGWSGVFTAWAAERTPRGSVRDGWDLARALASAGTLDPPAAVELAVREAVWHYAGDQSPRRRARPAVRHARGVLIVQVAGRIRTWRISSWPQMARSRSLRWLGSSPGSPTETTRRGPQGGRRSVH